MNARGVVEKALRLAQESPVRRGARGIILV